MDRHHMNPQKDWNEIKHDIHSGFLVMLHSTIAFPKKTAGETAQEVIKVFEKYAFPLVEQEAIARERERITEQLKAVSWHSDSETKKGWDKAIEYISLTLNKGENL